VPPGPNVATVCHPLGDRKLDDHQAVSGDAVQAVPVADGSISSGQITTFHLQTSGGVPPWSQRGDATALAG